MRFRAVQTRGTCRDILKHEQALFTFVREEGVEPTNNSAERALRHAVIWRTGSFGTWSADGSAFVSRILTVVTTLRHQGRHALDSVAAACTAAPSLAVAGPRIKQGVNGYEAS